MRTPISHFAEEAIVPSSIISRITPDVVTRVVRLLRAEKHLDDDQILVRRYLTIGVSIGITLIGIAWLMGLNDVRMPFEFRSCKEELILYRQSFFGKSITMDWISSFPSAISIAYLLSLPLQRLVQHSNYDRETFSWGRWRSLHMHSALAVVVCSRIKLGKSFHPSPKNYWISFALA